MYGRLGLRIELDTDIVETIVAGSTNAPNLVVRDEKSLLPAHKDESAFS
jgi:hypothetical protein